jgi:raffinose/stachyose/melibiose transport system permease protein
MISRRERVMNIAILSFMSAIVLIPLGLLLAAATSPTPNGRPAFTDLRWENFAIAWERSNFGSHLLLSLTLSLTVVLITLAITPLAAYGLAVLRAPGHKWVFFLFLAGIMIPLEGIIVPLYFTMRSTPLASTVGALIIAHAGLSVSFGVFWMRASFRSLPPSILESAMLDGAGHFRLLWSIIAPITKPALITLGLLTFMWTWNDYFLAFVLVNNPDQLPVTVALGQFSNRYTTEYNLMSAAAVLVAMPILVLYVVFQRRFIEGVLSGAVKG